jgi:hypothetical protein
MGIVNGMSCAWTDGEQEIANIIYVSMLLGFCGTRLLLGEPVQFDLEQATKGGTLEPLDAPPGQDSLRAGGHEFGVACRLLDTALSCYSPLKKYLHTVKGSATPMANTGHAMPMGAGGIIVGRPGGSSLAFRERLMEVQSVGAAAARREYWRRKKTQAGTGYQGIGAYVGIVDDPVNNTRFAQVTQRAVVKRRWTPIVEPGVHVGQLGLGKNANQINLSDTVQGMGHLTEEDSASLRERGSFGYTHGMVLAIGECVKRGPWCIPFEMAAGESTKKLASCFMCTVYMYSAGYPPSSIHLDRAESWWPLVESKGSATDQCVARSLNDKWRIDCRGMLLLGLDILAAAPEPTGLLRAENKARKVYLEKQDDRVRQIRNQILRGNDHVAADMFLDSALHHANDKKKIKEVLGPLWPQKELVPGAMLRVSPRLIGRAKDWP